MQFSHKSNDMPCTNRKVLRHKANGVRVWCKLRLCMSTWSIWCISNHLLLAVAASMVPRSARFNRRRANCVLLEPQIPLRTVRVSRAARPALMGHMQLWVPRNVFRYAGLGKSRSPPRSVVTAHPVRQVPTMLSRSALSAKGEHMLRILGQDTVSDVQPVEHRMEIARGATNALETIMR